MSLPRAPTAIRTPISRVRSVTLTSMMFMIPMPPTSSDTPAIAPSRIVIVFVVEVAISMISCWLRTWKSSSAPARIRCRCRSSAARSSITTATCSALSTCTVIARNESVPVSRTMALVHGTSTRSSWSMPIMFMPFGFNSPTTVYGAFWIRTICPTGLASPNRFVATVCPRIATFVAARTSEAVKFPPSTKSHARIST